MRDYLRKQYDYTLDSIPVSLGGTSDPDLNGYIRYQLCLSKVTNQQSMCYQYYSLDCQAMATKSANHIVFLTSDRDRSVLSPKFDGHPSSLLAIVPLKGSHDTISLPLLSQMRAQKRESSSSIDHDKRQRSNESLIEEESPVIRSSPLRNDLSNR
jgi:hypothetical protein